MRDVTFVIKTFERPACLSRLLTTLRRQYPSSPIIVADDSEVMIPPIRNDYELVGLPFDVGLSVGRNEMLKRVQTKFFCLLDDDFVFTKKTDIARLKQMAEIGNYDIVAGALEQDGEIKHYEGLLEIDGHELRYKSGNRKDEHGAPLWDIVFNFFVGRTDAVRRVRWDDDLKLAEHTDFFLRAKREGLRVGYCPDVVVIHAPERAGNYLEYRMRGKQFFKLFMRKHGITRVVNFEGKTMDISPVSVDFCIKTFERHECVAKLVMSIAKHAPRANILVADDSHGFRGSFYRQLWREAMDAGLKTKPTAFNLGYDAGLAYGRNFLVEKSSAEYLLMLDDDFVFTADTDISKMVAVLENNPSIGVVGGCVVQAGQERHFEGRLTMTSSRLAIEHDEDKAFWRESAGVRYRLTDVVWNFALWRRRVFDNLRWDSSFKISGEHLDMFHRLKTETNWQVAYCPAVKVLHDQVTPTPPPVTANEPKRPTYEQMRRRDEFLKLVFAKYRIKQIGIFDLTIEIQSDGTLRRFRNNQ